MILYSDIIPKPYQRFAVSWFESLDAAFFSVKNVFEAPFLKKNIFAPEFL